MAASLEGWLKSPWHIGYGAFILACQGGQTQHVCPVCLQPQRNQKGSKDPWSYMSGCLTHLRSGTACLGSPLKSQLPGTTGESMIPTAAELLKMISPKCVRDFLPLTTVMYVGPGGHRQWPISTNAMLNSFTLDTHHKEECYCAPREWRPKYLIKGAGKIADVPPPPIKFLDIGTKMGSYVVEGLIPDMRDRTDVLHPRATALGMPKPCIRNLGTPVLEKQCGAMLAHGSTIRQLMTSTHLTHSGTSGDYPSLFPLVAGSCLSKLLGGST